MERGTASQRQQELRAAARRVICAALEGDGVTPPEQRRAAFAGRADDPYLDKVRRHAYRVTDEDIEGLSASGLGDDAIFELTLAAALGAASERLDVGLALLGMDA